MSKSFGDMADSITRDSALRGVRSNDQDGDLEVVVCDQALTKLEDWD